MQTETWSKSDEKLYLELRKRRDKVMDARMEAVRKIAASMDYEDTDILVNDLIANADALIDALKPYDSGVRQAEE